MSKNIFQLIFVVSALLTVSTSYSSKFPSGRYEIIGYLHLDENPRLVVANQTFVFNGDTIETDSNGKYTYSVFWVMVPGWFTPKAHYTSEFPKYMNVNCMGKVVVFFNNAKKYGYNYAKEGKFPIVMFNIPVSRTLIGERAKIVDYRF